MFTEPRQRLEGQGADARDRRPVHEAVHRGQRDGRACAQRRLQAGPAKRFGKGEAGVGRLGGQIFRDPRRQAAPAHRQHHQIGRAAQLGQHLEAHGRLALDDVGRVEGRQELRALLGAEGLGRGQGLVEIVAGQHDLDRVAAEDLGLVDLLLGRGDRHEDRAARAEMAAGIGHALGMVAGAGADEMAAAAGPGQLAHGVEGAAQLVAAHGRQILALEPDLGAVFRREMVVALQGRGLEQVAKRGLGQTDGGDKVFHAPPMPRNARLGKHSAQRAPRDETAPERGDHRPRQQGAQPGGQPHADARDGQPPRQERERQRRTRIAGQLRTGMAQTSKGQRQIGRLKSPRP